MRKNRGGLLTEDQAAVFERCEELFEDARGEGFGWKRLKWRKQFAGLTTWSKCAPTNKGENSIAAGKAVGIIDSSAEEVAAWTMDYCGQERMRISREQGHPARLVLTEEDGYPVKDNEITVATVKRMPFFLNDREFVTRMIWRSNEGKVSVAIESVDDNVDDAYGRKIRKTRSFTRALWEFENLPQREGEGEGGGENQQQCKTTLVQSVDAGGSIPSWVTNRKIPAILNSVQEAIDHFRRVRKTPTLRGTLSDNQESFEGEEQATQIEQPVEECSWFFVGVSFLFTTIFPVLMLCYSVTTDEKYLKVAYIYMPIAILPFVMAIAYKPKRTDATYIRFLYFHFFTFAVVSEVAPAITYALQGREEVWVNLLRLAVFCSAFRLGLKLRESVAKLPPQELSDFMCQTVLVKGTAAMGPLLFLSFEIISCYIGEGEGLGSRKCTDTSYSALFLSLYLVTLTTVSIFSKAVPKSVQRETAFELSAIASLKDLKRWQVIQGGLMTVSGIVSLYLLGGLGVKGNDNEMVVIVGSTGLFSMFFACLVNATMLVRVRNEHQRRGDDIEMSRKDGSRSARAVSSGQVEEGMFAAALV
ncbi:hypothetical protein TrST_g10973 [Triparma strigata]|uniref:START domain-containing protein n=1 Tax=Triparma strigata TaxID=1606541 RepID=A0A9W7BZ16_9STRA|nr:hypothetical protein TrST_g10973 [Triparma strigata]